jgi:hypothetical protein
MSSQRPENIKVWGEKYKKGPHLDVQKSMILLDFSTACNLMVMSLL